MNDSPIMQFDSHIAGKNALVKLYPDRIEWSKKGLMSTGAKATLGVMTAGASLLATGVRGKHEDSTILVRSIASVTTKKAGLTKTEVNVHTPAGIIGFKCSSAEAAEFKTQIFNLLASRP